MEGHLFQLLGDVENRVVDAQLSEHVVGRLLDDAGAWVEVLVAAVAEAHESGSCRSCPLALVNPGTTGEAAFGVADGLEHLDDRLVACAARQWSPQCGDASRHSCCTRLAWDEPTTRTVEVEQFCSWSACKMKSLLRAGLNDGVHLVLLGGHAPHHVHEVPT